MSKKRLAAILLFIFTAVLHFQQPPLYGVNSTTIGYAIFGIVYLSLASILYIEKQWTILAGIAIPCIGLLISLADYFTSSVRPSIYPLLALIDVAIIVLCIAEFNNLRNSTKRTYSM